MTSSPADVEKQQATGGKLELGPVEFSAVLLAAVFLLSSTGCLMAVLIIWTAGLGDCPAGTRDGYRRGIPCEPTMDCSSPGYLWTVAQRDSAALAEAERKAWPFFFGGLAMALIGLTGVLRMRGRRINIIPFAMAVAAFLVFTHEMVSNGRKRSCSGLWLHLFDGLYCANKPVNYEDYDFTHGCMPRAPIVWESKDMQNSLVALAISAAGLMWALAVLAGLKEPVLF